MNPRRLKAYTFLFIATCIWGAASVIIKLTLEGIAPLPFLTYRFSISALIALFYIIIYKPFLPKSLGGIITVFIYGLFSTTLGLGFLFLGLELSTVLNLALITLMGPLLLEFGGVIFLKEKITKREKLGTAIAFGGTALTIIEPIVSNHGGIGTLSGNILIFLYMFFDLTAIILLKKLLRKKYSPSGLGHISFLIGFLTILPIALLTYSPMKLVSDVVQLPFRFHLGVWYMAIFSGTIAYILRAQGQKSIEVSEASLFGYLAPIISSVLAVLVLKETITPLFMAGAAVIIIGLIVAEYKPHST